ncbi:MAG TPA: GFA family protein [Steroidobacteraceae bacterium]|nr:GFA family protein [Steroidobacteraceae bacterium]
MTQILTGHCLCGAIRYRCGPLLYPPTLCHCESCRRACAAHAVGWLTVRNVDLAFTGATPREFASSPGVQRTFCGNCGTPLTYRNTQRPLEVDITVCSLEDPALAAPVDHIWMQDAPAWDSPADGLSRHLQGRQTLA